MELKISAQKLNEGAEHLVQVLHFSFQAYEGSISDQRTIVYSTQCTPYLMINSRIRLYTKNDVQLIEFIIRQGVHVKCKERGH